MIKRDNNLGISMLTHLMWFAFIIHFGVVFFGLFSKIGPNETTSWELTFSIVTGASITLLTLGKVKKSHATFIILLFVVLIGIRFTQSWLYGSPTFVYGSTISMLLYFPPLIASGIMLGVNLKLWLFFVIYIGLIISIGANRTDLLGTPFEDWRVGPAFIGSYILLCTYYKRWFQHDEEFKKATIREQELSEAATKDLLTGLLNRRAGTKILQNSLSESTNVTVMMMDLDRFKNINDTFGHQKGDEVLIQFSKIIRSQVRKSDIIVRWGGEEFIVILSNISESVALMIADKFRSQVEIQSKEQEFPFTVSIGVSQSDPNESYKELLNRADEALYIAKKNGRNCVFFLSSDSDETIFKEYNSNETSIVDMSENHT